MTTHSDRPASTSRRPAMALAAIAVALAFSFGTIDTADARAGRSSSMGSRGVRTYQAPPVTNTAPSIASPIQRSTTPTPQIGTSSPGMSRPGFFGGGGFMPGLFGGLLGAGLVGMLFGGGFLGGLGSFSGFLGFLLQMLLIVFLVRMALRFFRTRSAAVAGGPAYAGGPNLHRQAMGGGQEPGYGSGRGPANPGRPVDAIGVGPADYQAFEAVLTGVQTAYGREDLNALRSLVTPEMLGYFSDELADNARRGVVNELSNVHLLQGDLAESWREGGSDYATVAMRFSLIDVTVERGTGRVVDGDPRQPVEATEIWTFTRPRGGRWLLSAIQQTR